MEDMKPETILKGANNMAQIIYNESTREFHLQNSRISYILCLLENGQPGHLYFGKRLTHRDSFQHFIQIKRPV